MATTHTGSCTCGAVTLEMNGDPLDMGYCHCAACRKYSGAPVNAFVLWKEGDVKITQGEEHLTHFQSSAISDRRFCAKCGAHVRIDHPGISLIDVRAAVPSTITWKPTVHLNYEETILPMKDGLPKLRDFPKEIGGSGEILAE
jgi:hypothetical protein